PATVIGAKTCDNGRSTNSSDEFVAALVDIMLLQIVGEQHFSQLAVDHMSNTQTLQGHQHPPSIRHQLAWCDLIVSQTSLISLRIRNLIPSLSMRSYTVTQLGTTQSTLLWVVGTRISTLRGILYMYLHSFTSSVFTLEF